MSTYVQENGWVWIQTARPTAVCMHVGVIRVGFNADVTIHRATCFTRNI